MSDDGSTKPYDSEAIWIDSSAPVYNLGARYNALTGERANHGTFVGDDGTTTGYWIWPHEEGYQNAFDKSSPDNNGYRSLDLWAPRPAPPPPPPLTVDFDFVPGLPVQAPTGLSDQVLAALGGGNFGGNMLGGTQYPTAQLPPQGQPAQGQPSAINPAWQQAQSLFPDLTQLNQQQNGYDPQQGGLGRYANMGY